MTDASQQSGDTTCAIAVFATTSMTTTHDPAAQQAPPTMFAPRIFLFFSMNFFLSCQIPLFASADAPQIEHVCAIVYRA